MNSKKLLILLVMIFLYVNFYDNITKSNTRNIKKMHSYTNKLFMEKSYLEKQKILKKFIQESNATINNFENTLYSKKLEDSLILNNYQTSVKKTVLSLGGEVVNTIWGEAFESEKKYYKNIPIRIVVRIEPEKLQQLLNTILKSKLFSIKEIFITRQRNKVIFNMQIILYKKL